MKILVTGGDGMLASAIKEVLTQNGVNFLAVDKDKCDITKIEEIENVFNEFKPDIVINCAAYTQVDAAEVHKDLAFEINANGALNIATVCKSHDARLVHYSTDYVFSGNEFINDNEDGNGYLENAPIAPINVYGASKAEGEKHIKSVLSESNYYIVRTAWLYGPNGPNFVETMLRLAKENNELSIVNDQHGSPTLTKDLAVATTTLIGIFGENYDGGVYHLTNAGHCSWYEYTKEIFSILNLPISLKAVSSESFKRPAPRPENSILINTKGPKLRSWKDALKDYLTNLR